MAAPTSMWLLFLGAMFREGSRRAVLFFPRIERLERVVIKVDSRRTCSQEFRTAAAAAGLGLREQEVYCDCVERWIMVQVNAGASRRLHFNSERREMLRLAEPYFRENVADAPVHRRSASPRCARFPSMGRKPPQDRELRDNASIAELLVRTARPRRTARAGFGAGAGRLMWPVRRVTGSGRQVGYDFPGLGPSLERR